MTTIDRLISDYRDQNANSYRLFQRAQSSLPGGNTRTGVYLDPFPVYLKRGAGVHVTDLDDNQFIDMAQMGIGSAILGYADPELQELVRLPVPSFPHSV